MNLCTDMDCSLNMLGKLGDGAGGGGSKDHSYVEKLRF